MSSVQTIYKQRPKTGATNIKLSTQEVNDIREAFELFLPVHTTTVKPGEMAQVFEKMGAKLFQPSIYAMIKSMDTPVNNEVGLTFEQFMDLSARFFSDRSTKEGVARIFMLFDAQEKGHLTKTDLRRISNELDIYLTSE